MADKKIYELDDGTLTTVRSQFIRQEFGKGKTRQEIVKMLKDFGDPVTYGIVASATQNMDNGTLQHRGRVYLEFENGEKVPRAEYIKDQIVNENRTVVDIAKELDIRYDLVDPIAQKIPRHVKKTGERVKLQLEDGTEIYRTEYIRKRHSEGATVREIADECACDYTTVYNTIRRKTK